MNASHNLKEIVEIVTCSHVEDRRVMQFIVKLSLSSMLTYIGFSFKKALTVLHVVLLASCVFRCASI